MSKYLFFSCFLICILAKLPAQENSSGSVNVKIVDASNKQVEFVNVILKKATDLSFVKGELSDSTGQCHFEKIKFGKYLIEASFIGYATVTTEAFTIDSVHSVLNLNPVILQPNVKGLKEVTVSSQVSFIERSENKTVLNVENSAVSSGSTAFDVLKRAPGVAVDKDDNIIVKGKSGIIVLMDGKQTYLSGDQLNNLLKNMPSE